MKRKVLRSLFCLVQGDSLGLSYQGKAWGEPILQEGLWSDDSSMVLASLDAFSYLNGFSMMKNFEAWMDEGAYTPRGYTLGMGKTTKEAILRFKRGVHPFACGAKEEGSNGNSALVRTWPLAVYAMKKFDLRKDKEKALSFIETMVGCTHAHPRSLLISRIYSELLWDLFKEGTREQLKKSLDRLHRAYGEHPQWVYLEGALGGHYQNSDYIVDTYASMVDILLDAHSFEEAIKLALSMGGDTSSRAALVGSLAGLIYKDQPLGWMNIEKIEEIETRALTAWLNIL